MKCTKSLYIASVYYDGGIPGIHKICLKKDRKHVKIENRNLINFSHDGPKGILLNKKAGEIWELSNSKFEFKRNGKIGQSEYGDFIYIINNKGKFEWIKLKGYGGFSSCCLDDKYIYLGGNESLLKLDIETKKITKVKRGIKCLNLVATNDKIIAVTQNFDQELDEPYYHSLNYMDENLNLSSLICFDPSVSVTELSYNNNTLCVVTRHRYAKHRYWSLSFFKINR